MVNYFRQNQTESDKVGRFIRREIMFLFANKVEPLFACFPLPTAVYLLGP